MGGAEAHLGLYDELVAYVVAVGVEGCAHPDAAAPHSFILCGGVHDLAVVVAVLHEDGLMAFLPLGVPVAVFHLFGLVAQRHGEGLHGRGEPGGVILRGLHIGLEAVRGLHEALVGPFVAEGVYQHVAPEAGVVHGERNFNILHNS